MFRVDAESASDYLDRARALRRPLDKLDSLIREVAPGLEPWFYDVGRNEPGMTFQMLGYGSVQTGPRATSVVRVAWPVIGVALQKNYFSVYCAVVRTDGVPLADAYRDRLGSQRHGLNNFSAERFEDLDPDSLHEFVAEAEAIYLASGGNPTVSKNRRPKQN